MDQVNSFLANQRPEAANRPPRDAGAFVEDVNREPIRLKLLSKPAPRLQTDEDEPIIIAELAGDPCRKRLGTTRLQAEEKLTNRHVSC
jgi:hypothetical protein